METTLETVQQYIVFKLDEQLYGTSIINIQNISCAIIIKIHTFFTI